MYIASQSLVQTFTDDITDESRSNIFSPDIRCLLNKTPVKIEINTDFKERYRGRETKKTRIDIKTEDLTVWSFTYQHLRKCLKPYELDCSKNEFLKCLLLKSAETALKNEFPESAHAIFDSRRETVSIYGSDAVKSQCQIIINSYLNQRESLSLREISLTGPNRVKGLIRHLLKAFGRDMGRLVAAHQPGLASAELELVTKMLVLSGDDAAAVQAAADQVERLAAEALAAAQNAPAANGLVRVPGTVDLECPVCLGALDAVTASDTATLCGHAYCLECIQLQATNAADVPLVCAAQNCGRPLHVANDILGRVPDPDECEQLSRRLINLAVKRHVADPRNCLQFCPTPDCPGMLRDFKLPGVREAKCSACRNTFCLDCRDFGHVGMSCADAKRIKANPDYGLEAWLSADRRNRKQCPKCRAVIEKNAGCNHMTCRACDCHFCWLCVKAFGTANEVYDHQAVCRGER